MKYKLIRLLGEGKQARVYLVQKRNRLLALKVETVTNDNQVNIEERFDQEVCQKYPDKFMTIIDKRPEIKGVTDLDGVVRSTVYSLVDTNLLAIKNEVSIQALYTIYLQIIDAINLMHSAGFIHVDLNASNIGIIYTDKKYIRLSDGVRIPTHGFCIKIIDYGMIKTSRDEYLEKYETSWCLVTSAVDIEVLWALIEKRKIKDLKIEGTKYDKILKTLVPEKGWRKLLYKILFTEDYLTRLFGRDHPDLVIGLTLPIQDLIFIMNSDGDETLVKDYLLAKLLD